MHRFAPLAITTLAIRTGPHLARRLGVLAVVALPAICLGTVSAKAQGVVMFDQPPTVEQVHDLFAGQPIRTRGIEIPTNPAAHRPSRVTSQASLSVPQPTQPAAQPAAIGDAPAATAAALRNDPPAADRAAAPEAAPAAEPSRRIEQPATPAFGFRINFAFNSTTIPTDAHRYLDAVGQVLHEDPNLAVIVEGHTDAVGGDAYNQALSERRAQAVKSYLVSTYNLEPARLVARGKGRTEPLTANPLDGANRRVQFQRAG